MPPTKHMTGDVFRGNLLDGFFNLAGALTGQGILLVGMMTEAVVTPWLSDRDIALQNVRYVLNAAGGLHEDFVPAPGGFIQRGPARCWARRSTCWSASSTTERRHPLLDAIADGTFGIMKRPADGGRGLDGVARNAAATTTPRPRSWRGYGLDSSTRGDHGEHRPAVRRHHRRRHGAAELHAADPAHDKRAEGAAVQLAAKMGLDPAMVVHAKPFST